MDAPRLLTQQILAGRESRDWIRQGMLPRDWVAVVSYDQKLVVRFVSVGTKTLRARYAKLERA